MMFMCQIRQRVMQILSIRGGSIKAIKSIMRGETILFLLYFCSASKVLFFNDILLMSDCEMLH